MDGRRGHAGIWKRTGKGRNQRGPVGRDDPPPGDGRNHRSKSRLPPRGGRRGNRQRAAAGEGFPVGRGDHRRQ